MTLIELIIVIALIGMLASAFVNIMIPMFNIFFFYPQSTRVNSAAADLIQIVLEGDDKAKGLRFTGLPCTVGGGGGGGSTITAASTAGTTSTLTYNYIDSDYCASTAGRTSHTVTLVYDSSLGTVTRAVDGGTAYNIPSYVVTGSDIDFSVSGGGTDIFHYFNSTPTDLGAAPAVASIYRVDIDVIAFSGSGQVKHNAGQIRLKSGVDIKRYTT